MVKVKKTVFVHNGNIILFCYSMKTLNFFQTFLHITRSNFVRTSICVCLCVLTFINFSLHKPVYLQVFVCIWSVLYTCLVVQYVCHLIVCETFT